MKIVEKRKNGTLVAGELAWSGGRMYHLCPVKSLEYAIRDLPRVAGLGFRGVHYIDVISVDPLRSWFGFAAVTKNIKCAGIFSMRT